MQCILDNGWGNIDRVKGRKYGQMDLDMWENGLAIRLMGSALCITLMGISMKEIGSMIRLMGEGFIFILMGQLMMGNGRMISSVDMEWNRG